MSFGFDAAVKALSAARLGLQTAGQNISNANTPGYSRQRILLASDLPFTSSLGFQIGTGVKIDGIRSIVDAGVESRLRLQTSLSGAANMNLSRWNAIEGLLNEPGGLSTQLSDVFDKIAQLQTDPAQQPLRSAVVQSVKSTAVTFNLLASRLKDMRSGIFDEAGILVRKVNELAGRVADLNEQILATESNGSRANDLRDTRRETIKEISDVVEVRTIQRSNGAVDVVAGGIGLVNGNKVSPLQLARDSGGHTQVMIGRSPQPLQLQSGQLPALLAHETIGTSDVLQRLDQLAYNTALEFNRIQTTGMPLDGGFRSLVAASSPRDTNGNGVFGDELLSESALPFDVQDGTLFVTTSNDATGELERTPLDIDPANMTLNDLAQALSSIDHVSASVDPAGKLRVRAEVGYRFDFSNRLDPQPDSFGSFGGLAPTSASAGTGPFDLSTAFGGGPATFSVDINGTVTPVSMDASEFVDISKVSTDELVTALNADLGTAASARNVGGRLVIRSQTSGSTASMTLTDGSGSPLSAIGLTTGTARTGQTQAVDPVISGQYTGTGNGQFVFAPDGDGQIGVTPGLTIGVFDQNGNRVATLDVGDSYSPGSELDVADGVKVAFGSAQVSATFHDVFAVDTIEDSDSTDVLVALGLNTIFQGNNAEDLTVNPDLISNPGLLAAGLTSATGDPDNLARLMELRDAELPQLGGQTVEDYYTGVVGDVGFETAAAQSTVDAQQQLLDSLQQQRDEVSAVNLDEEAIDMVRFQQTFDAASRFVQTMNEITSTLINLGR